MQFTNNEQFPSRFLAQTEAVKFDATNPEHRTAALTFLKLGRWTMKFEMEWPYTTVPQTVLMKLAEYACREVAPGLFKEHGLDYVFGDPFNTHPYTPPKVSDIQSIGRGVRQGKKPDLQVVNA